MHSRVSVLGEICTGLSALRYQGAEDMYCGIWGLISFPSSSSSAGASPALRASSNSNCFLWSSLDLNAAANQIWPPSQDHLTHKNSHISKFGCKAVCQIQRTNEFHNYKRKESSTHEGGERERESRSVWKLARLNNLSHIMPREIGFPKIRTEERGKKAPTKTQWKKETETKTTTHTHTHTKREEKRERDGDNLHDAVAMISGAHKLPDPQSRIPAKWIPGANACMQHAWKQAKEIKKRANALQKHQSAKP